jgi:Fic family protein
MYLRQRDNWPSFTWDDSAILPLLSAVRFSQGRLLGKLDDLGFNFEAEAESEALVSEVLASSRIEGITLDATMVRSSVSRRLEIALPNPHQDTSAVDGPVDILFDAAKDFDVPLSAARLFAWHAALFPTGYSGLHKIRVAQYRNGPMQVVSGPIGRERVHFKAPSPGLVKEMMDAFIIWFENGDAADPLIKAGIAHLWFVTIHPFDDGNGRIARALTELFLARSDRCPRRFYSMANQILAVRKEYYTMLEKTQKGSGDITAWLTWFLLTLKKAIEQSSEVVCLVLERAEFWRKLDGVTLNDRQRNLLSRLKNGFEGKLTTSKWAKICKVSSDTALRDINDLVSKGILTQKTGGGRSTSYRLTL